MGDLIWIGNTLIPRSVVIWTVAIVFTSPFVIAGIVSLIKGVRGDK